MTDTDATRDTGFPASTPVHARDGPVPIGDLRAGDLVASTDVTTGAAGLWPVLETHELAASTLLTFTSFDGEHERAVWCGMRQRFWVPTEDLADPKFLPLRDGPPPIWAPAAGNRSSWGSPRGWVRADDLTFGDQWIDAATVPVVMGWGHWKSWVAQTDRANVAWIPLFPDHELGYELTFDAAGAVVSLENDRQQTFDAAGTLHRFHSITRQLTVDRGHAFRVLAEGLLTADHVNRGGALMNIAEGPE